jgi:hypothetical protein
VTATPIAIIVVCRNAGESLRTTLDSVCAVSDVRLLPIVIDGASTDGTDAVLDTWRTRCFHVRSEPDRGIYDAMNKGWAAAPQPSYILYLGAGDTLLSLPSDVSLRDAREQPLPLVLGRTSVGTMVFRSRWTAEMRLRNTAHHQAMMILKSVSPEPPFDAGLRTYADWDFNLRLYKRGLRATPIEGLHTYAQPGGASWSMDTSEMFRVAARHSGPLVGAASWALNRLSRWRRFRRVGLSG